MTIEEGYEVSTGLAFVYFKFRFKWVVFFFVLVTLMMPAEVMILAMFRMVSGFGWQDTMTPAIIASFPPAIIFVLMQKPFMSGFAVGQNK